MERRKLAFVSIYDVLGTAVNLHGLILIVNFKTSNVISVWNWDLPGPSPLCSTGIQTQSCLVPGLPSALCSHHDCSLQIQIGLFWKSRAAANSASLILENGFPALFPPCGSGANANFTALTPCEGSIRGHIRAFAAQSSRFLTETSGKTQLKQRKLGGEKVRPLPGQLESGRRCWGHRKGAGKLFWEVRIGSGFSLLRGEERFGNVSGRK